MSYVTSIEKIGIKKGLEAGKTQGEAALLRRRFGVLPAWAEAKLAGATTESLERRGLQLLEAANLEAALT
jgi:hypothetical protein